MFKSIRSRLLFTYIALAIFPLLFIGGYLIYQNFVTQQEQTLALQSQLSQRVAQQITHFVEQTEGDLKLLIELEDLPALSPEEQQQVLEKLWAHNDVFQELTWVNREGDELARVSRTGTALANDSQYWRDNIAFYQPLMQEGSYFGAIQFDEEIGEPLMAISIPVTDLKTGFSAGVLIATVRFKDVWNSIADTHVREGESIYIVDSRNQVVAHRDLSVVLQSAMFEVPKEDGRYPGLNGEDSFIATTEVTLGIRRLDVVVERSAQNVLEKTASSMMVTLLIIVISLAIAVATGVMVVTRISTPLTDLVNVATAIQEGDFSQRADERGVEEVSQLAVAFNGMTARLRKSIDTLEQNIVARTQALETSIEVSHSLSTLLEQDELVSEVVTQIQDAFHYYHAHIYVLDEAKRKLVLAGGTGEAGKAMLAKGHFIPMGKGLVGRVAETESAIVVADVEQNENWLSNPLLPKTKSEAAVPISVGGKMLGVLDVQQDTVNGIHDEDVRMLQSVANQFAIALRNARLYAETQKTADQQMLVNEINQKIQQATTVESALQIAVREVGRAVESGYAAVQLSDFMDTQEEDARMVNENRVLEDAI